MRRLSVAILTLFLLALTGASFTLASLFKDLPDPAKLEERKVVESTKIYDRTGNLLLYEIHGEEKRTVIPFEKIPPHIKNATVALEDANFYKHGGIDFKGITRAFFVDIFSRSLSQGGSTITQQLIKNSLLGRERTIQRKAKEVLMAILLESRYSKDEILSLYLNQIPYGSNAYGIEAASQTYFGTSTEHITLAQAALLASLPKAPSYYSPYGSRRQDLFSRKNLALDRMASLGYVTPDEAARAKNERLEFSAQNRGLRAPHFVMHVREILNEKYGEGAVEESGFKVYTTIDWKLQEQAEKIVREGAESNEKLIKAKNAALVAMNPKNGEVLAMVGSRDYFDLKNDGNFNVATALRQPGSAFKPFVYATAFKKGYLPETVLFDVPTEFHPLCNTDGTPGPELEISQDRDSGCYHPQNYDEKFRGPVSLRQAIAQSLNVPSVKVLYLAGVEDSIQTAEAAGITTLKDRSRFGLSLVLGGGEVKLLELTSAYGVFAADGILHSPKTILRIEAGGKVIEEQKDEPRQVIDPGVARTINELLSDDEARAPVFQLRGSLWLPDRQVAAKTGTTQEFRDAWTIGYTPSLVVGVWAGNNDNTPMEQKGSGVMAAAPLWNKFMRFALKDTPPELFPKPEDKKSAKPIINGVWSGDKIFRIDKISRKLATDLTPADMVEEVAFGEARDPLFWIDKHDPLGPPPSDPHKDPQFKNWEAAFQLWAKTSGFAGQPLTMAPTAFDDVHTAEAKPKIKIDELAETEENYIFTISVSSLHALKEVNAVALDLLIASNPAPSQGKINLAIKKSLLGKPPSNIKISAYDAVGNWNELEVNF